MGVSKWKLHEAEKARDKHKGWILESVSSAENEQKRSAQSGRFNKFLTWFDCVACMCVLVGVFYYSGYFSPFMGFPMANTFYFGLLVFGSASLLINPVLHTHCTNIIAEGKLSIEDQKREAAAMQALAARKTHF